LQKERSLSEAAKAHVLSFVMAEQTRATATEGDTTLSLSPDTGFVAADESAIDDAAGGFSVEGYAREFPAAGCPADAKCPWLRNAHPKVVG
jgi:hypothetical protein